MAIQTLPGTDARPVPRTSWAPMAAIAMAQMLLVLNVTTMKVAIDAIATSFDISASKVKSAVVVYSLAVAALMTIGAKLDAALGARRMFRLALVVFAASMAVMACSPGPGFMTFAQAAAGAASGVLVPALVVLISENYAGQQQARALGWLAAVQAMSIVPAILVSGLLATWPGWRYAYGVLVLLALGVHRLSERCRAEASVEHVHVDKPGAVLAILAVVLIGLGVNNVTDWGSWWARPRAPFSMLGVSPAPVAIVCGALLIKVLLVWSRRLRKAGGAPLIPPEAFETRQRRSTLLSMLMIGLIGAAITYAVPLYIEIIQGRSSLYTAVALLPFAAAGFAAALVVGGMRRPLRAGRVASIACLGVASGTFLLGATLHNDWSDFVVVTGMIVTGAGEGALGTLLFKLITAGAPRSPDADVTPLCGATDYLAAGVGTALASALIIMVLAMGVQRELARDSMLSNAIKAQVDLDNVSFVSNDRLREALSRTSATPDQVDEAVRINTQARLQALRICFFVLTGLAVVALAAVRHLPDIRVAVRAQAPAE